MIKASTPLFMLGQVVATPGAIEVMKQNSIVPADLLDRHIIGDFGDVCEEDKASNDDAVLHGERILSSYSFGKDAKVWIITEADRSSTHPIAERVLSSADLLDTN